MQRQSLKGRRTLDGGPRFLWLKSADIHTCQGSDVVISGSRRARSHSARWAGQTRPEERSRHDQSIEGDKALSRTQPEAAKAKTDLHHKEHLPDLDDARA